MNIKKITTRKAWSAADNAELVALYNHIYSEQLAGRKVNKSRLFTELAESQGRSKGSCECKAMNVSAVRQYLGLGIAKGLKALNNYNGELVQAVKDAES